MATIPAPPAVLLGEDGLPLPPSKSALKRMAKEAEALAKKALRGKAPPAAGMGRQKEKHVATVVEEAAFIEVPEGQKKDLTNDMASGYNPTDVERSWYAWWRDCQFFVPAIPSATPSEYSHYDPTPSVLPRNDQGELDWSRVSKDKTFVIPAPPPNVTGKLHIGHALAFGLQDTLIRWHRMRGFTTLFVPGFDHAGISTQSVVEKRLMKTEGLSRHDLGREKFLERCMAWKEEYQQSITGQIERLGVSCDWDRVAFTMNDDLSRAVAETFVQLHEDGIIYRANRLVNWCVQMNTTLSNLEVDQLPLKGRTLLNVTGYPTTERFEFGVLTSFIYKIHGSDEQIIVATTRPETMLGDTAIAVNGKDARYLHLHGKFAIHPFVAGRKIPIIADDIAEMEFGTGAVKITPAHDPNDYMVGERHSLEFINILNDDGTLNANAGEEFAGMKRFHARNVVVSRLKDLGLYVGWVDNEMAIPICSKSGDIIESVMKPQWWIKTKPLADEAIKRTEAGELKIRPDHSRAEWFRWLNDSQDWCISRQLWWGHRAPAYFVTMAGVEQDRLSGEFWVSGRSREEAQAKAELKFPGKTFELEQDEDVLDTWFSSGLWPFSIQGWPNKTPDLEAFYPANVLETGWDILFFWVARMVMLGIHLTGKVPFHEVVCHAMIRDAHGRKMSKSLGNVIDPIDVIEGATLETLHAQLRQGNLIEKEIDLAEKGQKKDFVNGIPQCGTDALRFSLANYSVGGRDINLKIDHVHGYRKFCNKIWNATKFAMLKFEEGFVPNQSEKPTGNESLVEKWILQKLNKSTTIINNALEERNFMAATAEAYRFWLYELCDVYIEAIKLITDPSAPEGPRRSAQNTLYTVLDNGMRLLHPFMPFVTEELWQRFPRRPTDRTRSIMLAKFPEFCATREFPAAEADFEIGFAGTKAVRGLAVGYNLTSNVQAFVHVRSPAVAAVLRDSAPMLQVLIKGCTALTIVENEAAVPAGCVSSNVSSDVAVHLLLKGVIDTEAEITKAQKKLAFAQLAADKLKGSIASPGYEAKKPLAIREKDAKMVRDYEIEMASLTTSIAGLLKLS